MSSDLLQPLQVLTQLVVQDVGHHLAVFAVLDILLSVEQSIGDLVLARVGHDSDQFIHLMSERGTMCKLMDGKIALWQVPRRKETQRQQMKCLK